MSEPSIVALLVEDDARLAALTQEYLGQHGVLVTVATNGDQGLAEVRRQRFDVVLLDVMLPGRTGLEVCQRLREHSDVPIIMITARTEEADRVLGLELGADDYVPKPFSPRELLARIRAQVRRASGRLGRTTKTVRVAQLVLDPGTRQASFADAPLELTSYEFSLLYALAERAGRVLSRDQLMELARGNTDEAFDRSVDVHVSRLRQKLGPQGRELIKTVRGIGYQFVSSDDGFAAGGGG